jgi:hypothetical protein
MLNYSSTTPWRNLRKWRYIHMFSISALAGDDYQMHVTDAFPRENYWTYCRNNNSSSSFMCFCTFWILSCYSERVTGVRGYNCIFFTNRAGLAPKFISVIYWLTSLIRFTCVNFSPIPASWSTDLSGILQKLQRTSMNVDIMETNCKNVKGLGQSQYSDK